MNSSGFDVFRDSSDQGGFTLRNGIYTLFYGIFREFLNKKRMTLGSHNRKMGETSRILPVVNDLNGVPSSTEEGQTMSG